MQDALAILIAVAAAAFLLRRAWQRLAGRHGACGSCGGCPSGGSQKPPTLVTISPIVSHAKPQKREEIGK
ncbi:MAG TPA: FeoB-associated Cys-rich membrane protein [Lacipirellulaceae bacterium]|nr:FeoB-associated Cys-rich membrane protein [Lacipirellulaceae bacterium]